MPISQWKSKSINIYPHLGWQIGKLTICLLLNTLQNLVNQAIFLGFNRSHPVIAVGIFFDFFVGLAAMFCQNVIQIPLQVCCL